MKWKLPIAAVVVVAVASAIAFNPKALSAARKAWGKIRGEHSTSESRPAEADPRGESRPAGRSPGHFDGTIAVTQKEAEALGLALARVVPQTEPMLLRVQGKTDYDPETLNKIRPKFSSRIDRVYVAYGQNVKQGDPLVDLFSADLAEKKGDFESKTAAWQRDKTELDRANELLKTKAISPKEHLTAVNDEKQSSLAAKIAKDKLMVYGLNEAEIANVPREDGIRKARMTLRSPADGVVIQKEVVKDNLYDDNDVLLTIAPLDHFWVHGYIYPGDATRISIGQSWVIHCAAVGRPLRRQIDSITTEIDPETKTIKIRTTVDNEKNRIKANMLVDGEVEIPAQPGRTVIPRLAMVSSDGGDFAFVRHPGNPEKNEPDRFERKKIAVLQERDDEVIVTSGLEPGQEVATKGSLILSQLFEDSAGLEAGAPR